MTSAGLWVTGHSSPSVALHRSASATALCTSSDSGSRQPLADGGTRQCTRPSSISEGGAITHEPGPCTTTSVWAASSGYSADPGVTGSHQRPDGVPEAGGCTCWLAILDVVGLSVPEKRQDDLSNGGARVLRASRW